MYSTCLFCHTELGANEAVEHFPVGRRLAFDAAKGRLWVVCRKCERWNLTPVEERWEAIEECERAFRDTRLRISTEHIGLGRVREGTELVRIGAPLRPEFAAWRYGDQFGKRRKRQIAVTGAGLVWAGLMPFSAALGGSLGIAAFGAYQIAQYGAIFMRRNRIVARLTAPDGHLIIMRRHHVEDAMLLPGDRNNPWGLRLEHSTGRNAAKSWWQYDHASAITLVYGDEALRISGQILPSMNSPGASKRQLKEAINLVEKHRDADAFFRAAAKTANRNDWTGDSDRGTLLNLPMTVLLALEMVSHEESERQAMVGDLRLLEAAWREAEEIAGISDDMFLPEDISRRLDEMKGQ
ncbi:MAG TPA: hypothetical protein VII30_06050 [Gemmatimonadaceae bacterium]